MDFVSPTSKISVALLRQLQVNFERITEWLAIIQSLQTLQQKKLELLFYKRLQNDISNTGLQITALVKFYHIRKLYPCLYVIHLKQLTADFIALRVF